ncbi:MAG: YlqD family protein [Coprothermobacterota bacterium]|nr:YlqD family protein [Caldisericota bacterium]MDI6868359.1 YlqD family protein [Coprothermobacterota bacterium]
MLLKQTVLVKAIVTESFRQDLLQKLRAAIKEIDLGIEQLETQGRRYLLGMDSQNIQQMMAVRQEIEEEKRKQELVKAQLNEKVKEVESLPPDSEYPQGTLEGLVEVKVGDDLFGKIARQEIVIKDGIIVEIR